MEWLLEPFHKTWGREDCSFTNTSLPLKISHPEFETLSICLVRVTAPKAVILLFCLWINIANLRMQEVAAENERVTKQKCIPSFFLPLFIGRFFLKIHLDLHFKSDLYFK